MGSPGPELQRQANRAAVLQVLADGTPRPVTVLRSATALSRQTLETILTELVGEGWLEVAEVTGGAGAGRPARQYALRPSAGYVAGVDVGVGKVLVVVADLTGSERTRVRTELAPGATGRQRRTALRSAITAATASLGLTPDTLLGIAGGVPGIVDATGAIARSVVVPEWVGADFGVELSGWAGCPVELANDANLALLAEHWTGVAQGARDVVYLLAGVRTRAAIMINGAVHLGRHGAAGEVGSVPQLFFDTPHVLLGPRHGVRTDVAGVFGRAARGGSAARARVDAFCTALAQTISTLALVLDPDLVVIGGGVSRAGAVLRDGVVNRLATDVVAPLQLSGLGEEAVALGAVRHALAAAARSRPALAAIVGATPPPIRPAAIRTAPIRTAPIRPAPICSPTTSKDQP
ncbi:MAG: ROK family protein [Propionibacteriaceae bacterium]